MKRIPFRLLFPLLLLVGLIAFPSAALSAAKEAAALWWHRVFPALLPFMLCCRLIHSQFIMHDAQQKSRMPSYMLPVFFFGAISGYPAGAKLLGGLQKQGRLTPGQGQRMAVFSNLCSPGFLLSVIALGLYGDRRVFFPLFLPGLATAMATLVLFTLRKHTQSFGRGGRSQPPPTVTHCSTSIALRPLPYVQLLTDAIGDAIFSLLQVGGCLIACAVFSALLFAAGLPGLLARLIPLPAELIRILLGGMMEMTWGANALSASTLSLRMQLALCCFFTTFGGLSVYMQSLCFMKMRSGARYLLAKLLMGLCAGVLAYALVPLFVPDAVLQTLSQGQVYAANALATGSILAVSAVSLLFAVLLGIVVRPRKCNIKLDGY